MDKRKPSAEDQAEEDYPLGGDMAKEVCENCGKAIKVSINKGQGYCSENCKSILLGDPVLSELIAQGGRVEIDPRGIR